MKPVVAFFFVLASVMSLQVSANPTGWRKIEQISCGGSVTDCWIVISGDPVGPTECQNRIVMWDASTSGGTNQLRLLSMAYAESSYVSLGTINSCYPSTAFPTFANANVGSGVNDAMPIAVRGVGQGLVKRLMVQSDTLLFGLESHTNAPACSTAGSPLEFAISLRSEVGRAMYSLLLTAAAQKIPVSVTGSGHCNAGFDREQALYADVNL